MKSVWGFYYGIYKAIMATQPVNQALACLICANDAAVANYIDGTSVLIKTSGYDSMLSNYATALYDFNNAF